MADEWYALSRSDVDILKELIDAWRAGDLGKPMRRQRSALPPYAHHFAAVSNSCGIPAMSSTNMAGYGDATLVTVSTSGLIASTTIVYRVYSLSNYPVNGDTLIQVKREQMTGRYLVDFENCS